MDLKDFLKDDDELVRNAAKVLTELNEMRELEHITKEEYDELVGDTLDTKAIEDLCSSIEQKAKVEKAFNSMSSIISGIF